MDEPLDVSPDSVSFLVPSVDIVRQDNDGRVKMFADNTDALKLAFTARGANDKPC